jgi:hypothetical protein
MSAGPSALALNLREPRRNTCAPLDDGSRGVHDGRLRPPGHARLDPQLQAVLRPGLERRARRLLRSLASPSSRPHPGVPRRLQRQAACCSSAGGVAVPPKKCLVTGCHARALPGNSRCETHRLKSWSNAPARPDLRTREWAKLSKKRRAAFPICEIAGCSRPSTSTDHRVPVSEGGTAEWGTCKPCARRTTAQRPSPSPTERRSARPLPERPSDHPPGGAGVARVYG